MENVKEKAGKDLKVLIVYSAFLTLDMCDMYYEWLKAIIFFVVVKLYVWFCQLISSDAN